MRLLVVLLLSGCATCQTHPIACTVVGVAIATGVAMSLPHDHPASKPHWVAIRHE